ncbi:MAG TPA: DUF2071 domain-containing protein [Chitinophagaceae bacterium]|jgi:hypothetical protein|nr:DUF2071 domain-containing protein [Chitinophagaceae bacterium]
METFLSAHWEHLVMANYTVPPEVLKPYLPHGVTLDLYHEKAYVSLVGFMFKDTRLFKLPIPFLGTFEEINLRFYVKRTEGGEVKRGVVFINETVPYQAVAWLANQLYQEHYLAIPTKNRIEILRDEKIIRYEWKINKQWNHLEVNTSTVSEPMVNNSIEAFIFEHYYGYTKISDNVSQEYKVNHPSWLINKVNDYSIQCDFKEMYGNDFSFLNSAQPDSVIFAEGSPVTVNWKRTKF